MKTYALAFNFLCELHVYAQENMKIENMSLHMKISVPIIESCSG